ncbi:amino acid adenylation domain-containing protein [Allofrancisella inopinata]|uniref:Amino acid adenylation domain-containing protein n=1 Tax=Allofrancisella inopinata TaxID=1085647 RepID=A0AAE6YHG9_9GAMM|nr:non-ribosomal peptide synthetase [Allofrancisella inopinata]QIV96010.1 amino acid adenylation domain-containing protein [Allofrancisella inopinata]TDT67376.1 amino acid adenylation domain-containing protein [Allofrancisella inopinata]
MIKASPYTNLFWNEFQLDPDRSDYNIVFDQRISGSLDIENLNLSLQKLISEHFILNSHLVQKDEDIFWEENEFINELEIYGYSDIDRIKEWVSKPFNIEKEPLYRFGLFKVSKNEYDLVLVFHHVLIGGNLFDEVIDKISKYYNSNNSKSFFIEDQKKEYIDYVSSLHEIVTAVESKNEWGELLGNCLPKVNFSSNNNQGQEELIEEFSFNIESERLNLKLLKSINLSLFNVLITLYGYILSRYVNQEEESSIGISYPVGIKNTKGLIFGTQLNTLVFPYKKVNEKKTFKNLFEDTKLFVSNVTNNDLIYLPTSKLISDSPVSKLDVSFIQTNFKSKHLNLRGCSSLPQNRFNIDVGGSDLSLQYQQSDDFIEFKCIYKNNCFHKELIEQFCNHYKKLIIDIFDKADLIIQDYKLLMHQEYQTILYDWNKTDKNYPKNKTIYQIFEEQAQQNPNNIALVFEEESLTYKQLNEKANQLARYIRKQYKEVTNQELQADTLIPLCLERSMDMVIGILGVIKAGGAYVPMDPEYPNERFKHILSDTNAKLVITQSHLEYRLKDVSDIKTISIDNQVYIQEDKSNLDLQSKATDLAYVIYTSGTTGMPKGVMVEHLSLVNRCLYMCDFSSININDVYLFKTNYLFDVSVSDIFTHLLVGAKLLMTKNEFDLKELERILKKGITSIHCVPSQFDLLEKAIDSCGTIKKIYFSGEALDSSCIKALPKDQKIRKINYYGPTETGEITSKIINIKKISSIGKVFPNSKAYVLDKNNQSVPFGVIGELYIGGAGLARGYLNRPELTVERFVDNPFATESDIAKGYTRLYKTGDLVRWLPDGNIEYIGRNDFQVKIRGYRIELGEIESQLSKLDGIKQSVVLAKEKAETKSQYLVGYYVVDELGILKQKDLLDQLSEVLPEYMVPSVLVELDSMPLTVNGKLDRKALPDPEFVNEDSYVEPITELEVSLCNIYAELLGLERVGVTDDFFKIGGNSILAIKLANKISNKMGVDIHVAEILKSKNIHSLSKLVVLRNHRINITKCNQENAPLSFAQDRLWFIDQYEEGAKAYYIPILVALLPNINIKYLKKSIMKIIDRHEVLRSIFKKDKFGNNYQTILNKPFKINEYRSSDIDLEKQVFHDINTPFDLQNDFPIRVCIYYYKEETRLLINIHHIASDGWSFDIFFNELKSLYEFYSSDLKETKLPELKIQYKDYAYWQRNYLKGSILEEQLYFWKEKLLNYEETSIPADYIRPKNINYKGNIINFEINKQLSNDLRQLAKRNSVSLNAVMLAGFYILLYQHNTSQKDLVIGMPTANRHFAQIQNLIGFFVNTLVIREKINIEDFIHIFIKKVQSSLLDAQKHQDLPFEKLIDLLDIDQDQSRNPIFQILFVVQSFISNKIKDNSELFCSTNKANDYYKISRFDLEFFIDDSTDTLTATVHYATNLYKEETIQNIIRLYKRVLTNIVNTTDTRIKDINLLNIEEYKTIVYDWNAKIKSYPKNKTIYQLFNEQVEKSPNNIALVFENQKLTYKELNEKSNQLARHIRKKYEQITGEKLKPNTLIPLCLERNLDMIIGILAVMKAGGAYVPLEPGYPDERFKHILCDTKAKLIITQNHLEKRLKQIINILPISIDEQNSIYEYEEKNDLNPQSKSADLAYIIYTSGTTGLPKGVMVEHRNVIPIIKFLDQIYDIKQGSRFTQFTSYVFDVSIAEIFAALTQGATLFLLSEEEKRDTNLLSTYLIDNKINYCYLPPVILSELKKINYPNLKALIYAGEPLDKRTAAYWSQNVLLYNLYGPTETSIYASYKKISGDEVEQIGHAIPNVNLYVLNEQLKPVPVGLSGELYIGGPSVARGYLNNPKLTEEKFIYKSPCSEDVLYKTGDIVRWLSNGSLEYFGRNDSQVKIHGYRIELKEIQSYINKLNGIKQSVILAQKNKETNTSELSCYYLVNDNFYNQDSLALNTWEEVYDENYDININNGNYIDDFSEWKSYITGDIIPLKQMRAWRNTTISRVKSLNSKRILEIGVGSGLLMYPLLEDVEQYVGIDISKNVIERHKRNFSKLKKTTFYHLTADKINEINESEFDCIIINSVIQYFPHIKYFEEVLEKALSKLTDEGTLFIGDVRDYNLHKDLIKEKLQYNNKKYNELLLSSISLQESELLVAPEYFINLLGIKKDLQLDILEKDFSYNNELSNYRYDVLLTKQKQKSNEVKIFKTDYDNISSINFERNIYFVDKIPRRNFIVHESNNIIFEYQHYSEYGSDYMSAIMYHKDMGIVRLSDCIQPNNKQTKNLNNIPSLSKLRPKDIKNYLSKLVPEYMVPNNFIELEYIPLTTNGKINYKALPKVEVISQDDAYIAPSSELEKQLCNIWKEALNHKKIGTHENFFEVGGNSILAIKLVNLINIKLSTQIKVKDLFDYNNVHDLALLISGIEKDFKYREYTIKPNINDKYNPFSLTNVQQAYLYGRLSNFEMGNVSTHSYFELIFESLDVAKLEKVLNILISRHDALRTVFTDDSQTFMSNKHNYSITYHTNINKIKLKEIRNRLSHKIYDVSRWPLFDIEVSYHESKYILHLSFDILIMDGSSFAIFFSELAELYNSANINEVKLPQLDVSFKDYIESFEKVRNSELFKEAKRYWVDKLSNYNFDAQLPMIVKPSEVKEPKFTRLIKVIDKSIWNKLEQKANRYSVSPTTVVLYAYGQVLTRYSGTSKFCINLTLFNRLPLHEQVNNLLGDFTVLELFNFDQSKLDTNISQSLKTNHEELWNDIEHNLFDGIDFQRLIRKELHIGETQSLAPIVLTSVLGDKDFELKMDGYIGRGYSITQTSQVYLDNKAYETSEGFIAEWDYVEQLFDPEVISSMHKSYCDLIE